MSDERPNDPNELMTRQEVAKMLGISVTSVQNHYTAGRLDARRVGRLVRIRRQAVWDFLEGKAPAKRSRPDWEEDPSTDPPTPSILEGLSE